MSIEDFGQKIGGAKKDLWKLRGLAVSDLVDMNDAERVKFVTKDNVWKKPDYQALVDGGLPVRVVYFMKMIRDATPVKPDILYKNDPTEVQDRYVAFVAKLRDAVMELKTEADVRGFYDSFIKEHLINTGSYYVKPVPEAEGCITNKMLRAARVNSFYQIDNDIKKKQFCYSEEDKILAKFDFLIYSKDKISFETDYRGRGVMKVNTSGFGHYFFYPPAELLNPEAWEENTIFITNKGGKILGRNYSSLEEAKADVIRDEKAKGGSEKETTSRKGKKRFVPAQLENVKREGVDYRFDRNMTGEDYLERFGFRGGEFGNWMSELDRQVSLNYGFDALMDLSRLMGMHPKDVSLNGGLSIAFGARGSGNALAHYEPMREVINLTKMRGAGSLAHEWGHALDDALGKRLGLGSFATDHLRNKVVPESLKTLMEKMRYKEGPLNDALKFREQEISEIKKRIVNQVDSLIPDKKLTSEQIAYKNQLVEKLTLNQEGSFNSDGLSNDVFTGNGNPEIDALSALRKETCRHVISKDDRVLLMHRQNNLRRTMEMPVTTIKVKTDFYQGSIEFDSYSSKTGHGYWQSPVEMFARAFACYVSDKLEGRNDYLCGHANMCAMPTTDKKTGEPRMVCAIPMGEERRVINQCFDEFIAELKEIGLISSHDYSRESFIAKAPELKTLSLPNEPIQGVQLNMFDLFDALDNGSLDARSSEPPRAGVGSLLGVAQDALGSSYPKGEGRQEESRFDR